MEEAEEGAPMLPGALPDEGRPRAACQRPSRLSLLLATLAFSGLLALAACSWRKPPAQLTGSAPPLQRKFDLPKCSERCQTTYSHSRSECSKVSNWNVREKATCITEAARLRVYCQTMCLQRKASCLGVWAKGASQRKLCAAACYKHLHTDKINSCIERECDGKLEKELDESGCEASEVPTSETGGCHDTRPDHYYSLPDKTFKDGLPAGYQPLGKSMTKCELYQLQQYCVEAINTFRAGRPFSDGRTRDHGELPLLRLARPAVLQCSNQKALSDLKYSNDGAGCGHHTSSLTCDLGEGTGAENSCCTRHCSSLEECKKTLDGCLQSMWDEGERVLDTGEKWSMKTGHYYNMIGTATRVSCGFGFDDSDRMVATQQFFG